MRAKQYAQESVTLLEPLYSAGWSIKQGEYHLLLYIENPFLPELSSNILPATSRNLENLPDDSRLFQILLDSSRSSSCTAVLAQWAHGYMYRLPQTAVSSQPSLRNLGCSNLLESPLVCHQL